MADLSLRRWLSKQPHPESLAVTYADGSEKSVRIGVARSKFVDAEAACANAVHIEALDGKGAVLRVTDLEAPADGAQSTKGKPPATTQEAMLVRFAELLKDATDAAAARHEAAYRLGFDHLSNLVSAQASRLNALELLYQKMVLAAQPAESESTADLLAKAILPGLAPDLAKLVLGSGAPAPASDNGKAASP